MELHDAREHAEPVASQSFHYDNYSGYEYSLIKLEIEGRCGLACVEELEKQGSHSRILLPPIYQDIRVRKISTAKANYDRYVVYADGRQVGDFTMVLNAWVPSQKS